MTPNTENGSFYGLGIAPGILEVLAKLNFKVPTPIQQQSIPIGIEGKDLMGIAQTGTGKTLAFGIPLIQKALQGKGLGLVIVPTRELAIQVNEALEKVGRYMNIKTAVLIGGEPIFRQIRALRTHPQIIVGTPGRIVDHIEQKTVNLSRVQTLVLDEADRMLDMGFAPQLKRIHSQLTSERQTLLFSATMPEQIVGLARVYMKLPVRVEIARQGSTAKDVTQELFFVPQEAKPRLLEKILKEYKGSVIIFGRTKFGVRKLAMKIRSLKDTVAEIHSDRSLGQRKEAMLGFRGGRYRILVATDIAARGIDVSNIELVINYDLPDNAEDYVHRIGRTGRAGGKGHAISFARPNQRGDVIAIERLIRLTLPVSKLPDLPFVASSEPAYAQPTGFAPRNNFPGNRRGFGQSRPGAAGFRGRTGPGGGFNRDRRGGSGSSSGFSHGKPRFQSSGPKKHNYWNKSKAS